MEHKKLYKSDTNRVLTGVLGGVGEYFSVDPTIVRLGFVLITICTGVFPAIIAYVIAMIIIPEKFHSSVERNAEYTETPKSEPAKEEPKTE